MATFPK